VTGAPSEPIPIAFYLDGLRTIVETALVRARASFASPPVLQAAIDYALTAGGKRLRPSLTLAVAEALGAARGLDRDVAHTRALPAACAVEFVHTYSLVHDDLPAMDNDDLRRGRPTTHVVHGDGLAILVGDALLTEAFGLLTASPSPVVAPGAAEPTPAARLQQVAVLASTAGAAGMVGGQAIDLAAAGRVRSVPAVALDATALEDMHARKTGALMRAAAALGALAVDADDRACRAIEVYARELGLAFQIIDDVLDVEASSETLGKTAGKDAASGKPTYPAQYGVDGSRMLAADCAARAVAALDKAAIGGRLADIARWSLRRQA
jgi:geranylgeranyl pyrophosphate synthase